jgi:hypothetical protein
MKVSRILIATSLIILISVFSSCSQIATSETQVAQEQPVAPENRLESSYTTGALELRFEGFQPYRSASNIEFIFVQFAIQNPTATPFLLTIRPRNAAGSFALGTCAISNATPTTDIESHLEPALAACDPPSETITSIQVEARNPDSKTLLYHGLIKNVKFQFQ